MSILKRILALVLACAVPPASGYLMRGLRPGTWINLALFMMAHGVFWAVAAAPGLAVMGLAVVHALILSLLPHPRPRAAVS